jgi:hypothetical protein
MTPDVETAGTLAATAGPLVAVPSATGPGDGQEYDFPPPKSAPPVSIMAPEGPPPREATASESADVMPQPLPPRPAPQAPQATPPPAGAEPPVQSAVVTPMPPRRPPQVRAPPPPAAATPQPRRSCRRSTREARPHRPPGHSASRSIGRQYPVWTRTRGRLKSPLSILLRRGSCLTRAPRWGAPD